MLARQITFAVAAGTALLGLQACTTLPVTTDVNPNLSATSCHTYVFAQEHVANAEPSSGSAFGNPLNAERLRVAIESNLAAKGVQKASDRAAADCVVGYALGSRQVFDDYYGGWGLGYGFGGWGRRGFGYGAWAGYDGPFVRDETRIAVDLFDAKSRKPIWHATVSQNVSDLIGPNAEAKINAGTAAIFATYPMSAPLPDAAGHAATT